MSLNKIDIENRVIAYDQIELEIQAISSAFKVILILSRKLSVHKHSGEKETIKKLIGEMVDLSIRFAEGKKEIF